MKNKDTQLLAEAYEGLPGRKKLPAPVPSNRELIVSINIPLSMIKKLADEREMSVEEAIKAIKQHYNEYKKTGNGLLEEHIGDLLNF